MDIELDQSFHLADIDYLSVLSAFDEGVIIADKSGRIVFYNQTQAQIDDLEPDYVIGKSVPEVYNLDHNSSMILRCIKSGRPILGELFFYRTCRGKLVNIRQWPLITWQNCTCTRAGIRRRSNCVPGR